MVVDGETTVQLRAGVYVEERSGARDPSLAGGQDGGLRGWLLGTGDDCGLWALRLGGVPELALSEDKMKHSRQREPSGKI